MTMANPTRQGSTREQQQELRQNYRELTSLVKSQKEQLSSLQNPQLHSYIQKANTLHQNVEKPKEHAMDAQLFATLSEFGEEAARKLAMNNTGQGIGDFVRVLKARYIGVPELQMQVDEQPELFHWQVLDEAAAALFCGAPGVNCMLGPMEAQAKVRKAVQQRAQKQAAPIVRPEELHGQDPETDKQETDRNMEEMWNVIEQLGPGGCPFAELICNHKSFAQTVENAFTFSFLVRDHRVELWRDEQRGMMLRPVPKAQRRSQQQGQQTQQGQAAAQQAAQAAEQHQFVLSLTMALWQDMCRVVRPADCKMTHREHQEENEDVIRQRRQQQRQQQQQRQR